MSDIIGRIAVPTVINSGQTFPLTTQYPFGFSVERPVIVHRFGSLDAKQEQRYYVGIGPRKFQFKHQNLNWAETNQLKAFWEGMQGPWKAFTYTVPNPGGTTTGVMVTFEQTPISFEYLLNAVQVGLNLIEVGDPAQAPTYAVNSTCLRFPSTALSTALLSEVQQIIPLVHIRVRESAVADIYVSDRRVTVGGQLYLPRLIGIGEPGSDVLISQDIKGTSDNVRFTFGNGDRVMTQLANDTDLKYAEIDLCLFHVNSGILLQLWKGVIQNFTSDGTPIFPVTCSDGFFQIMNQYPERQVSRQCEKTRGVLGLAWRAGLAGGLLVRLGPGRRNVGLGAATTGQLSRRTRKARHGSAGRAWKEGGGRRSMLLADPIGALPFVGFEGLDLVPGLLHRAGHEAADGVTLPAHGFHDLGDAGPALPLEHLDNLGRLAAPTHACGFRRGRGLFALGRFLGGGRLLGRLALHRRALGGLCASFRLACGLRLRGRHLGLGSLAQALDACPDAAGGRRSVLEFLGRLLARQAVQDSQQALGGPTRGQLCEFLLAGEAVERRLHGDGCLFWRRKRHDFVRFVDRKCRHFESPLATLCAANHMNHSEALESKGISEINRPGRTGGDEARRLRQIASGCVKK